MRRVRLQVSVVLAALIVAAILVVPGVAAAASKRTAASGTIAVTSNTVLSTRQVGQNTKTEAVATVQFDGTLVGPATENYTALTLKNGTVLQRGVGSFAGSIDGRTGTLEYVFHGTAADGGVITITHATGELRGVHGQIRYTPSADPAVFDYAGALVLGG